jgi:hypothetical protein
VPPGSPEISGDNIRLDNGPANVSASASDGGTYRTTVDLEVTLQEFVIRHTTPRRARISSVTLDGAPVEDYGVRQTNRGEEVLVNAPTTLGEHRLVVETAP